MNFTKEENYMIDYITEQLHNSYGYTETEGKTLRELKFQLGRLRAMDVNVSSPDSGWF